MLEKNDIEKIKKEVEKFFSKMDRKVEVEILIQKDNTISVNVKTNESQDLIGEKGETLLQIQHLLRLIFKKIIDQDFYFDLDIGGYKKKKIEYLKELARVVADEVALNKKEKILEPMSAYERRIIHLELAARPDVITESVGKEPNRRIIVKPYP